MNNKKIFQLNLTVDELKVLSWIFQHKLEMIHDEDEDEDDDSDASRFETHLRTELLKIDEKLMELKEIMRS